MAVTLNERVDGSVTKTVTVNAGKILKLTIDDVEDTDFQITAPAGKNLTVDVVIKAKWTS